MMMCLLFVEIFEDPPHCCNDVQCLGYGTARLNRPRMTVEIFGLNKNLFDMSFE